MSKESSYSYARYSYLNLDITKSVNLSILKYKQLI